MRDPQAIHDEIYRIREETDASREVRLTLQSIEEALSAIPSDEQPPGEYVDRVTELRAEVERLSDEAEGETAAELDRLQSQIAELEREERADPDAEAADDR
ncbi:hypothetical protein [Halorussus sp. AFM4]|uniref:hypothetical protein n=1 Tax=Halorussus sp. AFM4 TaxID=3421651 RepID=UPI003EBB7B7E